MKMDTIEIAQVTAKEIKEAAERNNVSVAIFVWGMVEYLKAVGFFKLK